MRFENEKNECLKKTKKQKGMNENKNNKNNKIFLFEMIKITFSNTLQIEV